MAPEDRIRPDPALAVVDDGALVVGSQEDHSSVEVKQRSVAETLDLAVRYPFPIADDPPNALLGRKHLCHSLSIAHEDPERAPLGLEPGRVDVAQILTVHLERRRHVALDLDLVQVVEIQRVRGARLPAAAEGPRRQLRQPPRRHLTRGDEIEAEVEACLRRRSDRQRA